MGAHIGTLEKSLGVTEHDVAQIHQYSRRRKVVTRVVGAAGTIVALVAGYASARAIYYDEYDDSSVYPFVAPLALAGSAAYISKRSAVGIAASMLVAFGLTFAIGAAAYTKEPIAVMYNVWDGN